MEYGFVYLLKNESMKGIYKIGFTTKHPRTRMAELSRATSCPVPFELLAFFDSDDPQHAERRIHNELAEYRVNSGREFFHARLELIQNIFRQWCNPDEGVFYSIPLDYLVDQETMLPPWDR